MILVSVDPGLAAVGWARLDLSGRRPRLLACDTIRTKPEEPVEARCRWIREEVMRQLQPFPVRIIAIEDQAAAQIAARKLGKTDANAAIARDVQHQLVGMASGLTMAGCSLCEVVTLRPQTWRARLNLTGADDQTIKRAARLLCDGVPEKISIHAAEAICIGIAGGREAPKRRRKAA